MSATNSQGEETNDDNSQLQAESLSGTPLSPHSLTGNLLGTVPLEKSVSENKASDGEIPSGTNLENGSDGVDEERGEETSEEAKEDKEVKMASAIVPFEDQIALAVADTGSDLFLDGEDSGDEDEQATFMQELERFHIEHNLEYKPPKFYGKGLNCLK